jgi:serine/threonine protein kinase
MMGTDFADPNRSGNHSGARPIVSSEPQAVEGWEGNRRYRVIRKIGAGGMGVVYEAFDRERAQAVALKRLLHFTPAALYRFKQEFRTLADVHHPNLVRLYELVMTEGDGVFFTMELVFGMDFVTYVHGGRGRRGGEERSRVISLSRSAVETPTMDLLSSEPDVSVASRGRGQETPVDFDKLRRALRQLVEGIHALHGSGKLHRDIKPSNVLVTDDGRVVILDFGVSTEFARASSEELSEAGEIVGTAAYMAPEQALSETPTPSSDWYSVGVVLFEALVGRPPFSGASFDVITRKALDDAPAPSECVDGVPADLDALCRVLLARDPAIRPTGLDLLSRLGVTRSVRPVASLPPAATLSHSAALVGREEQLRALGDAFEQVKGGRAAVVRLAGASGMGKSTLVQHFLDGLVDRDEAVVLRGRTYERESVPFKALDSVIDVLSRYLVHLESEGEGVELPGEIAALARMFPVLRRVPSIEKVAQGEIMDPQLVRRQAFSALRELISALAKRRPLVVYIDDVQWGDTDSAALLLELIRPPDAPPVLLIATHRDNALETSAFLRELKEHWPAGVDARDITVGALSAEDGQRLALALLNASDVLAQRTARAVAREARGNPFLVEELVRGNLGYGAGQEGHTLAVLTLDQMVSQRLTRLPDVVRRVLEVVAVGGRPLPLPVIANASGAGDGVEDAIALGKAKRFVRTGLRDGQDVVEMSHDRFRETIVRGLEPGVLRGHHARLAGALEAVAVVDAEAIGMHLLGAGEDARAAVYLERAAEEALAKLAFQQAARLFRLALEKASASPEEARRLHSRLGLVLEWAGRGEEAARAYLDAAGGAPPLERAELERAAAIELLSSGRMVEGAQVLHRVLAAVGLGAPASVLGAVFWLIVYRLRLAVLAVFGFPFKERSTDAIPRLERARVDAVFSASIGFVHTDVILGMCMSTRGMLLALRSGGRFQMLRAALLQASQHAGIGGKRGKLERSLVDLSERLVKADGTQLAKRFLQSNLGVATYLRGEWKKALEMLDGATAQTQVHDHRAGWQTSSKVYACWSLNFLGEHRELARRHAVLLADAEERGDRYTSVQLRDGSLAIMWLVADDPQGGRRNAEEAIASWPRDRYLLQHWHMLYGEGEIELYVGDGAKGYARIQRDERALKKSLLLNVQHMRVQTAFLRGRCAIASLEAEAALRKERVAEVQRIARSLSREGMTWSAPFAAILTAAAANAVGDEASAVRALRSAIDLAERADMRGYVAASQYQLGSLIGGDEGQKLKETAEERMIAQGVRVPPRFAATLVPGRWGTG